MERYAGDACHVIGSACLCRGADRGGHDQRSHRIIANADTCRLYETWDTHYYASGWYAGSGAPWNLKPDALRLAGCSPKAPIALIDELKRIPASAFDVVNETSLQISSNSGAAR
jgi:hypothetical protein